MEEEIEKTERSLNLAHFKHDTRKIKKLTAKLGDLKRRPSEIQSSRKKPAILSALYTEWVSEIRIKSGPGTVTKLSLTFRLDVDINAERWDLWFCSNYRIVLI